MSHETIDIKKHVRGYIGVFVALACLTVLTVRVSYMHLATPMAITVALIIATVKASLVALYFMHLISEKKLIFIVLLVTVVFFGVLMFVPAATNQEMSIDYGSL